MKTNLLLVILLAQTIQAKRCSPLAAVLGTITGASAAAEYVDRRPVRPNYDFVYPGAPIYIYDYPPQVYSPVYSYINTRYSVDPSYYNIS